MADECDIAVIGGGIAGLTAAHHALDGGCTVTHILGTEAMGGLVCNVGELRGYPTGDQPASGIGLAIGLSTANVSRGVNELMANATSLSHEGSRFRITTSEGETVARQVIAATGARLRTLDAPGAKQFVGRGVSQCAWCDGPLYSGKDVVVVGGGDAALEEAHHLAQFAAKVTVVTRGSGFRARPSYVRRIAELENVEVRQMSETAEIIGTDGVEAVRVIDSQSGAGETIPCAGVFVFIGLEPNSSLIGNLARLDPGGQVETDSAMRTATPGLYAVGALRSDYGGRLVHAVGEAATAAMAAARACSG